MRTRSAIPLIAVLAACAACSPSKNTAPAASPAAATTILSGTVSLGITDFTDTTLGSATAPTMGANDACTGTAAYSGVASGLTVAVTGAAGQSLGETELGAGAVGNDPSTGIAACLFTFSATVPENAGTYTITVGSFGSKTVTESELGSVLIEIGA